MTKKLFVNILMVLMICTMFSATALAANGTGSLSDAVQNAEQNQNEDTPVQGDVYGGLKDAAKVDMNNETAREATSGLANVVGIIVTILAYVIAAGLGLRIMIDIVYITLPFTRGLLYKGGQEAMGGMGGMNGGMMGGGMGGGMMGGGMGMGGYNRGGMGMGGGMMGGGMGMGGMQPQQGIVSRMQFVSEAAIKSVALASQPMPDGSSVSPLRTYAKDMIIVLIVTPVLLVLATNGVLFALGIKIAEALSGMISGANF